MPSPTSTIISPELKTAMEALRLGIEGAAPLSKLQALQAQVDAIDLKMVARHVHDLPQKSLADSLKENESVQRILRDKKGRAYLDLDGRQVSALMSRKAVISATGSGSDGEDTLLPVGVATTGVLQIQRSPGITVEARQVLKIRDLLAARPTTMAVVDFVKVSNPLAIGSPVPEASIKPENSLQFTSISEKVRLIATWIPATRQVLDDFVELMGFIQSSLPYYIDLEEELQLLAGDDTGENLHGLLPQAQAFESSGLIPSHGWTKLDVVGQAVQQIQSSKEIDPTFVVLNVADYWAIRLTKDSFGRYILGDPQSPFRPSIFGLDLVYTTSIPVGTFLVGSGNPVAAEIRDRMGMQVEISTENQDYFVRNLVAIRAEKRLALLTKRPNSFVSGTFTTSP